MNTALDPEFIKQLLATKPKRSGGGGRRKGPKVFERNTDGWFDMQRALGSIIDDQCHVSKCLAPELDRQGNKRGRKRVAVDVPVTEDYTVRMCRYCYIGGVGSDGKPVPTIDKP